MNTEKFQAVAAVAKDLIAAKEAEAIRAFEEAVAICEEYGVPYAFKIVLSEPQEFIPDTFEEYYRDS